ncbi:imelysin family protein [Chitinibacteraceae bacterium HSL-7]
MSVLRSAIVRTAFASALLFSAPLSQAAVTEQAVLDHYGELVYASYSDSVASARALQSAVHAFTKAPSQAGLDAARKAWLDAREWYGQTEAFRFYGGPIDSDTGPEGFINAWPLDEAYIDYVEGDAKAGIINSKSALTAKKLRALNERGGEENIATGWHAIEFLLWGQDLSDSSAGNRPVSDFTSAKNADRRRQYLVIVTDMLVADLDRVAHQWTPGAKNYRAQFTRGGQASIQKMLTALGTLSRGELAGERIEVAMDTQAQEDEHSCFSDNTHRDIVNNARGIQNVWEGRFTARNGKVVEGASLKDLVAAKDEAVAKQTSMHIAASVAAAEAIPAPFDRAIVGDDSAEGRQKIQATVDALKQQTGDLVEAAKALGITKLNTDV